VELLPVKCKELSPNPKKRDANREEFGIRAGGNMWELLSCLLTIIIFFDKFNPETAREQIVWRGRSINRRCSTTGST